ncbi:homeodomain-interacting protein kinase 3-like [Larimichthys crocea]|uniref:homeodomain-interacting protein kinase 3-like n=1 Tax=Larimichthys crocea TaxID=215358 RepID=UPI000F5E78B0|nr:homeodomain-interacting protein kinase 3-like [Larimichthys crocea]
MENLSSSLSYSPINSSYLSAKYPLPNNYKLVSYLGGGGFGDVLKCIKKDTNETVAVKCSKAQYSTSFNNELTLMRLLMWKKLDKSNIVRFIDSFTLMDKRPALVFEMLDVTLKDYFYDQRNFKPLHLHEIRSIMQQLGTALHALKSIGVIHSDIKMDNIMLVNCEEQPLRVKLIDFGLAFSTYKVKQGAMHQTKHYRSPEIYLGLPFSEAIDMWSLGIVMANILVGDTLFPGCSEYNVMECMVDLLGLPPDHLLNAGRHSEIYFFKTVYGQWRLKTHGEYWGILPYPGDYRAYQFRSLDDVEKLPLTNLRVADAEEKMQCIALLKAMLQIDASVRITPSQLLKHPFIRRSTHHHDSFWSCGTGVGSTSSYPRFIKVRPAPPDCRYVADDVLSESEPRSVQSPDGFTSDFSPAPFSPEDINMKQEDSDSTSDEDFSLEMKTRKEKKKKKKNSFKRFFCWLKNTFSCITANNDEG